MLLLSLSNRCRARSRGAAAAVLLQARKAACFNAYSCCFSAEASNAEVVAFVVQPRRPLAEFQEAILSYPTEVHGNKKKRPWNLAIHPPGEGGHVVLGRNGTGKSLLSSTLVNHGSDDYVRQGMFLTDKEWYSNTVAHVSFESHERLLEAGGTAYKAISPTGLLSKAAQFLVVRFGLFPLLHRDVRTLSTGEIRKVMLVRALAKRPRLLILDNAFDGLDVESRENLKDLVSKTIQGFRVDMLVQAVSAKAAAHTQVVLMTHRPEEIVDEIENVTVLRNNGDECDLHSLPRQGRTGSELMQLSFKSENPATNKSNLKFDIHTTEPWNDPTLPTEAEIASLWCDQGSSPKRNSITQTATSSSCAPDGVLVDVQNLVVRRGEATLLNKLNWKIRPGERWLVAGGNGMGKSTLSRILAKEDDHGVVSGSVKVVGDHNAEHHNMISPKTSATETTERKRYQVGWVSTELHMALARSEQTAWQVLDQKGTTPPHLARNVAYWLELDEMVLKSRPFYQLSQGEQKLVLIAASLASRPPILVLDEPCQGLDMVNRSRVLGLCERVCRSTDMSLVYITHHLEELLPCVSNIIHLVSGEVAYMGSREEYNPLEFKTKK